MATRQGKRKPKPRTAAMRAGMRPARGEELAAESRALLGRDEEARAVRRPRDDASVQDPLADWPEE